MEEKEAKLDETEVAAVARSARMAFAAQSEAAKRLQISMDRLESAGFSAPQALAIMAELGTREAPREACACFEAPPPTPEPLDFIKPYIPLLGGLLGVAMTRALKRKASPRTWKDRLRELIDVLLD